MLLIIHWNQFSSDTLSLWVWEDYYRFNLGWSWDNKRKVLKESCHWAWPQQVLDPLRSFSPSLPVLVDVNKWSATLCNSILAWPAGCLPQLRDSGPPRPVVSSSANGPNAPSRPLPGQMCFGEVPSPVTGMTALGKGLGRGFQPRLHFSCKSQSSLEQQTISGFCQPGPTR